MATARSRVTTPADAIEEVLTELLAIRKDMLESTVLAAPMIQEVHPRFLESARNLLHYLALRRRDLRHLQQRLAVIGPASLARSIGVSCTRDAGCASDDPESHERWAAAHRAAPRVARETARLPRQSLVLRWAWSRPCALLGVPGRL